MSIFDRFKSSMTPKPAEARAMRSNPELETLRANVEEDKKQYPEDAEGIDRFIQILCAPPSRSSKQRPQQQTEPGGGDASVRVFLSEDRMTAYACIFPPAQGGAEITLESAMEELRYEGISYGIDNRYLSYVVQEKKYLHIFPVARGTSPEDGENGEITAYYAEQELFSLDIPPGGALDFDAVETIQPIRKGEIICRIKHPTKSRDGVDVTGCVQHGLDGTEIHIPSGENTSLSPDGLLLTSLADGIVYMKDGDYCVSKKVVINEDIGASHTPIEYSGDIIIRGNVSGGALVKSGGDIIVEGQVYDAEITSGRNIRLQKGIKGRGKSIVKAGGQIQSRLMEDTKAESGGDIYTEVILNCDVVCGGSIYATTGRGMIVGGDIKTLHSISAVKIGNLSNCLTKITLGYYSELGRNIDKTNEELSALHTTLEKIRRNVSTLKALPNISAEKKEVIAQLTEQKNLYLKRELQLTEQLKELKRASYSGERANVVSSEIQPTTEIHHAGKTLVIQTLQTNCNVHLQGGELVLR